MNFIGRKKELNFLKEKIATDLFEFGIIYGRRRVGKTSILEELAKNYYCFYYCFDQTGMQSNLKYISNYLSEFLKTPQIIFEDFYTLFDFVIDRMNMIQKQKLILIFDEFSYLLEKNPEVLSILQKIIDQKLSKTTMKLILSGSNIKLMEQTTDYNKALYGRATFKQKILPFNYLEAAQFYPQASSADKIRLYSIFGGLPIYLQKIDDRKTIKQNILQVAFSHYEHTPTDFFYTLNQEIRKPEYYMEILDILKDHKTNKLSLISNLMQKKTSEINRFLRVLLRMDIIEKEICFGEKDNPKKTFYRIKDQFFLFYFTFIRKYENKRYLFSNKEAFYDHEINPHIEQFVSLEFEKICSQFLIQKNQDNLKEIARYFDNKKKSHIEIDILCQIKKKIIAFECKWTNQKIDERIIDKLKIKISQITAFKIDKLGFFSKNGYKKNLPQKNIYYNLNDLYKKDDTNQN